MVHRYPSVRVIVLPAKAQIKKFQQLRWSFLLYILCTALGPSVRGPNWQDTRTNTFFKRRKRQRFGRRGASLNGAKAPKAIAKGDFAGPNPTLRLQKRSPQLYS